MTAQDPSSATAELTAVLDELIDVTAEVKQAKWLTAGAADGRVSETFDHLVAAVAALTELDASHGAPQLPVRTPSARMRAPLAAGPATQVLAIVSDDLRAVAADVGAHADLIDTTAPDAAAALRRIAHDLFADADRLTIPR